MFKSMVSKFGEGNKDVNDRVRTIQAMIKEQKFLEALAREDDSEKVDPESMEVEASYAGPNLAKDEEITVSWAENALEWMQNQKKIHKKVVWMILKRMITLLDQEPTLKEVTIPKYARLMQRPDLHRLRRHPRPVLRPAQHLQAQRKTFRGETVSLQRRFR